MYIVAFLSLHAGKLEQTEVEANSDVAACNKVLETNFTYMEEIYGYVANIDGYISVLKFAGLDDY